MTKREAIRAMKRCHRHGYNVVRLIHSDTGGLGLIGWSIDVAGADGIAKRLDTMDAVDSLLSRRRVQWWEVAWPLLGIGLAVLLWVADPPGKSWILLYAIGIGIASIIYFARSFRSH